MAKLSGKSSKSSAGRDRALAQHNSASLSPELVISMRENSPCLARLVLNMGLITKAAYQAAIGHPFQAGEI